MVTRSSYLYNENSCSVERTSLCRDSSQGPFSVIFLRSPQNDFIQIREHITYWVSYWLGLFSCYQRLWIGIGPWAPSQYKDHLSRYEYLHDKVKMGTRLSYLYNENSYTAKDFFILGMSPDVFHQTCSVLYLMISSGLFQWKNTV